MFQEKMIVTRTEIREQSNYIEALKDLKYPISKVQKVIGSLAQSRLVKSTDVGELLSASMVKSF